MTFCLVGPNDSFAGTQWGEGRLNWYTILAHGLVGLECIRVDMVEMHKIISLRKKYCSLILEGAYQRT